MHIFDHRKYVFAIVTATPIDPNAGLVIGRPLLFNGDSGPPKTPLPTFYDPEAGRDLTNDEIDSLRKEERLHVIGTVFDATLAAEYLPTVVLHIPAKSHFSAAIRKIEGRSDAPILGEGAIASSISFRDEFILFANEAYLKSFLDKVFAIMEDLVNNVTSTIDLLNQTLLPEP